MKMDNEPYYKEVLKQYPIPGGERNAPENRVAIVVGAGQSPGEGIRNGRATAPTFAREGAKVLCVDQNPASAQETVDMIAAKGGTVRRRRLMSPKNADLKAMAADAHARRAASVSCTTMSRQPVRRRRRTARHIGGSVRRRAAII